MVYSSTSYSNNTDNVSNFEVGMQQTRFRSLSLAIVRQCHVLQFQATGICVSEP